MAPSGRSGPMSLIQGGSVAVHLSEMMAGDRTKIAEGSLQDDVMDRPMSLSRHGALAENLAVLGQHPRKVLPVSVLSWGA